jgi:hypothetical protein
VGRDGEGYAGDLGEKKSGNIFRKRGGQENQLHDCLAKSRLSLTRQGLAWIRQRAYISFTAVHQASHVNDKTQTSDDWRNSGRGVHEADRPDARRSS